MLGNTNIVALVGAGESPEFSQKKLILFDVKKEKKVGEIFYEEEKILNVKLSFSMLAVSTRSHCYFYNFPKVKLARTIPCYNPEGIIALTSNIDFKYFAYVSQAFDSEGKNEDTITVSYVPDLLEARELKSTSWSEKCDISLVSFNYTGNLMAVACSQGTIINILKVPDLKKLITLYRGKDPTQMYQLSFSRDSNYLLNTSARGTLHIYDISSVANSENSNNLTGRFNISKFTHNLFQGAKQMITGNSEDLNCSIITYNYSGKSRNKFIGVFTNTSKLIYMVDEDGQFTELRIGDNQIFADTIRADDVFKTSKDF